MRPPAGSIGFVGLGLLGSALAERALAASLKPLGFDISEGALASFQTLGGTPSANLSELAQASEVLVLALPTDSVSRAVINEILDSLHPGTKILDATTGNPSAATELESLLNARGVSYLDTPISGSSTQVRRGEAMMFVGGSHQAYEEAIDWINVLAAKIFYAGTSGSAAKLKLVTNLVLGLNRAALAEGLVYAQSMGIEPLAALDALKASAAYSRIMDSKGEKMARHDFSTQAKLAQHLKDVRLILDSAREVDLELPLSNTHASLLDKAVSMGLGEQDNSAILLAIESGSYKIAHKPT